MIFTLVMKGRKGYSIIQDKTGVTLEQARQLADDIEAVNSNKIKVLVAEHIHTTQAFTIFPEFMVVVLA